MTIRDPCQLKSRSKFRIVTTCSPKYDVTYINLETPIKLLENSMEKLAPIRFYLYTFFTGKEVVSYSVRRQPSFHMY